MVFRLSLVTVLMAMFAVGFSELVDHSSRPLSGMTAKQGCYDTGAVCAPGSMN